jgi:hypothetical protein
VESKQSAFTIATIELSSIARWTTLSPFAPGAIFEFTHTWGTGTLLPD